jgi:hypothetical protein
MYHYQGRRKRAIEVLREAEKIPAITSEDLVISRLCRQMLPPLVRADARREKRLARKITPTDRVNAKFGVRPSPIDTLRTSE